MELIEPRHGQRVAVAPHQHTVIGSDLAVGGWRVEGPGDGKYPLTSTTRCVAAEANTHTRPDSPTRDTTAFGTVCPATKFRFDATGRGCPHWNTVANPGPAGGVTVTFSTTVAASPGTPNRPATGTASTRPAPSAPGRTPDPERVSAARTGLVS